MTKAKMQALEKAIARKLNKELASLPGKYGFELADFLKAVKAASGVKSKGRRSSAGKSKPKAKRRRRAVITEATRAEVKKLVEGGKTGSQIAKSLGISLPTVQNIKKALGLVKARS